MATLLQLALVFLMIYGLVRLGAKGIAGLGGARYRAYRQVANRFGGRYESRGLVDPPTVSFMHQGSLMRVGLAPVISGQPPLPRTRVVARFGRGLPFRMELLPVGRPAPPQPPKGTRLVRTGSEDLDKSYVIQANDPDIARDFLTPAGVRQALEALRRLAPPSGMLVSVNPERMLVQVDRNLGQSAAQLDLAVRAAILLHDSLCNGVSDRVNQGIEIVAAGWTPSEEGPVECKVCGESIVGPHVLCSTCHTPFHKDCWGYVGGCSTFGCTSRTSTAAANP